MNTAAVTSNATKSSISSALLQTCAAFCIVFISYDKCLLGIDGASAGMGGNIASCGERSWGMSRIWMEYRMCIAPGTLCVIY